MKNATQQPATGTTANNQQTANGFGQLFTALAREYKIVPKPKASSIDLQFLGLCKRIVDSGQLTLNKNVITPNALYSTEVRKQLEDMSPAAPDIMSQWITKFVKRMVLPEIASRQQMRESGQTSYYEQINVDEDTAFRLYLHENGGVSIILLDRNREYSSSTDTNAVPQPTYDVNAFLNM